MSGAALWFSRARASDGVRSSLAAALGRVVNASVAGALALTVAVVLALCLAPQPAQAQQTDSLMDRISNEKMQKFENRLTKELDDELSRYISPRQYVLAVKVIWNPNVVPVIKNPQLSPKQEKLPGFPIFVRAPDSPPTDESTPSFQRLEVKVLLDETLPEYYERFVRKLVPIVARMDFSRGDQVVVLKETFPAPTSGEKPPPTLPEKELMKQLGQAQPPGQQPPATTPTGAEANAAPGAFSPEAAVSPAQAAQEAYQEGRYKDALRIVEGAFQSATGNRERAYYLGMEGSILYTQGNVEGAKAAWQRSITYDPTNIDVHKVLDYLASHKGAAPQQGAQP